MAIDLRNIDIPPEVVNVGKYKAWLAVSSCPRLNDLTYRTSEGVEVRVNNFARWIRRAINGLPAQEQDLVWSMSRAYSRVMARRNGLHAQAIGKIGGRSGKPGTRGLILSESMFVEDTIELLGRMFTVPEVVKIIHEERGVDVREENVRAVLRNHITEIEARREDFRNSVREVRLYNKRPRLEELGWMYNRMKARYIALNSDNAYNAMLRTLEQLRKEAEGDVVTVAGSREVNVEATIAQHVQNEILKTINLKEIILARTAARMGIDPVKLITALHNSHYAQFIELSGQLNPDATMDYPSASPYDFVAIEANAEAATPNLVQEPLTKAETERGAFLKDEFLGRIRALRQEAEQRDSGYNVQAQSNLVPDEQTGESTTTPPPHPFTGTTQTILPSSKAQQQRGRDAGIDYFEEKYRIRMSDKGLYKQDKK